MTVQEVQEFAIRHGQFGKVAFLRRWRYGDVYTIAPPQDDDFGEPLVVVVETNGTMSIRQLSEIY